MLVNINAKYGKISTSARRSAGAHFFFVTEPVELRSTGR
jgi:hypothetical protein